MRRARQLLPFLAGVMLCSLVLTFLMHRTSDTVVAQWKQPLDLDYESYGPYYLSVVETDLNWTGFPLQVWRNHSIHVGRESGDTGYGHEVDYSFHPSTSSDFHSHLKKSNVVWTTEGVMFEEASGHRLFIPRAMFVGGR